MRLAGFFLKELHYETASFYTTIYLSYSIYIALSTSVIDNMSYEVSFAYIKSEGIDTAYGGRSSERRQGIVATRPWSGKAD